MIRQIKCSRIYSTKIEVMNELVLTVKWKRRSDDSLSETVAWKNLGVGNLDSSFNCQHFDMSI
ncbi:hypothetical protein C0J52_03122 [Blattella germanica]|nr:hypothetical protein C0J52_03122 [Blattella germanica]